MPRSQPLYLNEMAEAVANIRSYIGQMTYEEFSKDKMRIDAVARNFEIIGESCEEYQR